MQIITKLGTYTLIQVQPPDDGDAAIYHLLSLHRQALESLRQVTGLSHEIVAPASTGGEHYLVIARNDIFDILGTLA